MQVSAHAYLSWLQYHPQPAGDTRESLSSVRAVPRGAGGAEQQRPAQPAHWEARMFKALREQTPYQNKSWTGCKTSSKFLSNHSYMEVRDFSRFLLEKWNYSSALEWSQSSPSTWGINICSLCARKSFSRWKNWKRLGIVHFFLE